MWLFYFLLYLFILCAGSKHATVHVWRSEDNLQESVLSFHCGGGGGGWRDVWMGGCLDAELRFSGLVAISPPLSGIHELVTHS